jgi:hypothetical protein
MVMNQRQVLRWIYFCCGALMLCGVLGCESIITDASLPYSEKIVISGVLTAGDSLKNIHISRTVAPLDTFSTEKIYVGDAVASIIVDGKSYRLELQSMEDIDSVYIRNRLLRSLYHVPNLVVEAGKHYALRVEWRGKVATAETFVPNIPKVESAQVVRFEVNQTILTPNGIVRDTSIYSAVKVIINVVPNEAYGIIDAYATSAMNTNWMSDILTSSTTIPETTVHSRTAVSGRLEILYRANYEFPLFSGSVMVAGLNAFDGALYEYLLSINNSKNAIAGSSVISDLIYGNTYPNPRWNVKGDGIGLFVGRSAVLPIRIKS